MIIQWMMAVYRKKKKKRCKILDVLVLNRADGLNYYINKKQNIPHCQNNYKIKYQNHRKMNIETPCTQIHESLLSWMVQELQ
jgi:hypothetical protein